MQCCSNDMAAIALDDAASQLFKALSDPARIRIVEMLSSDGGELCACDFEKQLGLAQATVSHHLKTLLMAGIVTRDRRGTWSHYALVPEQLAHLRHLIDRILV